MVRRLDQQQAASLEKLGLHLHPDPLRNCQGASRPSGAGDLGAQRRRRRLPARASCQLGRHRLPGPGRLRRLLLGMFDSRRQMAAASIESLVAGHVAESFRLLEVPPSEQERKRREFTESWPYAPHLLRLLEEQVLVATDAQETRDMIRILANLYKTRGAAAPVLTAADFRLDDDASGIAALLDSVSNERHRALRTKARQNI